MDSTTLGAALALAKSIPGTAANAAVAAKNDAENAAAQAIEAQERAEQAAVDASAAAYGDIGLVVSNGKLCVRVEKEEE